MSPEQINMKKDPHSFSNPDEARVTHLDWKAKIDFNAKTIYATATWTINRGDKSEEIIFDTNDLDIEKVTFDNGSSAKF